MFERNKGKQAATAVQTPAAAQSSAAAITPESAKARSTAMIGPNIKIKGTITGEEDLLIHGKVEGTIELGQYELTVGQTAEVTANIHAKAVKIDGEVAGDINGSEKVIISKSGNVRGNIVAPRVTLEDGAIFKGSIDMDPGDANPTAVSISSEKTSDKPTVNKMAPQLDLKRG